MPLVSRDRRTPDQHAGAAQGPIQRLDQVGHLPQPGTVPDPERRRRDHVEALVGGILELADQRVGGAGLGEQRHRPVDVAVDHHAARRMEEVADLPHHLRGLLARPPQRRRRYDGRGHQRDRAADERVGPAGEGLPRCGRQRGDDDGLNRRLDQEDLPVVEQQRDTHREPDHQRDDPALGAEHAHQEVGAEDPERHPDGHLGDPSQTLAVRRTQRDDSRHRGEEGRRVPEDVRCHPPRDTGRDRALCDRPPLGTPPVESGRQRRPTPHQGALERVGLHAPIVPGPEDVTCPPSSQGQGSTAWCNPSIRRLPRS